MSELHKNKTTEHLAMVLCLQLADDFAYLSQRFGLSNKICIDSVGAAEQSIPPLIQNDQNAQKMYRSIIRNYKQHAEFLKGITYG